MLFNIDVFFITFENIPENLIVIFLSLSSCVLATIIFMYGDNYFKFTPHTMIIDISDIVAYTKGSNLSMVLANFTKNHVFLPLWFSKVNNRCEDVINTRRSNNILIFIKFKQNIHQIKKFNFIKQELWLRL